MGGIMGRELPFLSAPEETASCDMHADSSGLEGFMVEKTSIADSRDATHMVGCQDCHIYLAIGSLPKTTNCLTHRPH